MASRLPSVSAQPLKLLVLEAEGPQPSELLQHLRRHAEAARASSIDDALELIDAQRWHGLVIDIPLDEEAATQLLAAFRLRSAAAPVVLVSGALPVAVAALAIKHRAYFVPKPAGDGDWIRELVAACEQSRGDVHSKLLSAGLSSKEVEVVALMARGDIAREAATTLGISVRTAEGRVRTALKRSRARNLLNLIWKALIGSSANLL